MKGHGQVNVKDLLKILLCSSEKAAAVARKIREEKSLFDLLVQEKLEGERNPRFVCDFKTLADVLIQESIRSDLTSAVRFPGLSKQVFGEENSSFTNALGEKVHLRLQSTVEETADLLERIYDGNTEAAHLLAQLAHSNLEEFYSTKIKDELESAQNSRVSEAATSSTLKLNLSDIAFWIDPIDSTYEYIHGGGSETISQGALSYAGLANVTVLIGAFQPSTGLPLMGVINQPFSRWNAITSSYESDIYWGYCCPHDQERLLCPTLCSLLLPTPSSSSLTTKQGVVVCSSSEEELVRSALEGSLAVECVPGAGYKFLAVVQGLAEAYVLLKPNTFAWDSCGPHAILRAMGGNVLKLRSCLDVLGSVHNIEEEDKYTALVSQCVSGHQVLYSPWVKSLPRTSKLAKHCHKEGVIAFRDLNVLRHVLHLFTRRLAAINSSTTAAVPQADCALEST